MMQTGSTRVLFVLLGFAVASCGGAGTQIADESQRAGMQRVIAPFPVIDTSGTAYEQPFLGGFNVPRPQFVDIDGDGDQDLFLQEDPGALTFHENTGTPSEWSYRWRTDRYGGLEIGDWFRFVDIDSDGDFDLLTERQYSRVRYYRNDGTARAPAFVMAEDTLRDVTGEAVFSDRQNNPNIADIDCDGLTDLFIGRLDGTVTRYELDHIDDLGIPRFRFVEDRFEGIEIVAQFGSMHGANGLAFYDFDSDGDLDFFWGDFFEEGLLLIENRGTCASPNLRGEPIRFPLDEPVLTSGYNIPVFVDLDADLDQDLVMGVLGGAFDPNRTASDNLYYFENKGAAGFKLLDKRFVYAIDVGTESYPVLVDIDGDGDLDISVSNKIDPQDSRAARMTLLRNVGSITSPSFVEEPSENIGQYYHYAPAYGDLDADGDLDMLLGTWNKGISFFRNEGTAQDPQFEEAIPSYIKLTRGSNSAPELGDVDGDGDLDLFVGEASGTVNYYLNVGTAASPAFELVSDEFLAIDVGRRSVPRLVDVDGDGDLDLVVGSEGGELYLYRNGGSISEPLFTAVADTVSLGLPFFTTPAFGDLDGDGDIDLMSGGSGGGLVYYRTVTTSDRDRHQLPVFTLHE